MSMMRVILATIIFLLRYTMPSLPLYVIAALIRRFLPLVDNISFHYDIAAMSF